jgi:tetratricopeptide (TPR) repeat protein
MLKRSLTRTRLAIATGTAALFCAVGQASAAPADDVREAQRLYQQGRFPAALEKLDAALKVTPKDAQGRFLKGLILTEQGRKPEAIQLFVSLTEDFPELPEPYNNLAVLYASQGNYDKAKSALELAIHTHPTYATAHENLGDIYAQLASRAYDRALQLDKTNAAAQGKLNLVKELFSSQRAQPAAPASKAPAAGAPVTVATAPTKAAPAPAASAPTATPPTAAAPTANVSAAPTAAPAAAAAGDNAGVEAAVQAWAKAWAAKDVAGYLASYAPGFTPPDGLSRAEWEKQRRERIERPKSIEVSVKMRSVKVNGNEATASFRQTYRSDITRSDSNKTLSLVNSGGRWLITSEKSG